MDPQVVTRKQVSPTVLTAHSCSAPLHSQVIACLPATVLATNSLRGFCPTFASPHHPALPGGLILPPWVGGHVPSLWAPGFLLPFLPAVRPPSWTLPVPRLHPSPSPNKHEAIIVGKHVTQNEQQSFIAHIHSNRFGKQTNAPAQPAFNHTSSAFTRRLPNALRLLVSPTTTVYNIMSDINPLTTQSSNGDKIGTLLFSNHYLPQKTYTRTYRNSYSYTNTTSTPVSPHTQREHSTTRIYLIPHTMPEPLGLVHIIHTNTTTTAVTTPQSSSAVCCAGSGRRDV